MEKHWRYKNLYWSHETKQFEFLFKKEPKAHLCKARGCIKPVSLVRLKNGKLHERNICDRCRRRRWRVNNPFRYIHSELKKSAKRRGIYFDIHIGAFIEFCLDNNLYRDSYKFTSESLTVDRVDPDLGYTMDNIQVITQRQNIIKGNQQRKRHSKYHDGDDFEPDPF